MVTVTLFTLGATLLLDEAARQLAAMVKRACDRADLTQDFLSRCLLVPRPKLTDQLNGKAPFTALWRFFVVREVRDEFLPEFLDVLAESIDRQVVSPDLARLIAAVEQLAGQKRMAKASLPPAESTQPLTRSVQLPLPASQSTSCAPLRVSQRKAIAL